MTTISKPSNQASQSKTDALVGGIEITPPQEVSNELAILLWGEAGMGKTTLACTMPGQKLLINFDHRGPASIAYRDDVMVADYSGARYDIVDNFKKRDPFLLAKHIDRFDSIIIDSLSTIQEMTVKQGIDYVGGKASIERPSTGAYQARNALVLELVNNMLAFSSQYKKHVCFIAHEGQKEKNEEGAVIGIPIMLGGQLPTLTAVKLSEIWALYELGGNKTIAIRPCRNRGPVKTRMFQTSTASPEFSWKYHPEEDKGMKIADWHESWLKGGKKKIPLPK